MKQIRSAYIRRLLFIIVISVIVTKIGAKEVWQVIPILYSVYGIVFSVYASFSATFNLQGVRNPEASNNVKKALKFDLKSSIWDFLTSAVTIVIIGSLPITSPVIIYKAISIDFSIFTAIMLLAYLFFLVQRFYGLRDLRWEIDDELNR